MTLKIPLYAPKRTDGSDSPKPLPASSYTEMVPWITDIHRGKQT